MTKPTKKISYIKGHKSHELINQGLEILKNITHRGAVGANLLAGDGAGILIQTPDAFLRAVGEYGVGMLFLPRDAEIRAACEQIISKEIVAEGQSLLAYGL